MNATAVRAGIVGVALLLAWRVMDVNIVLYEASGRPRLPWSAEASDAGPPPDRASLRRALHDNPAHIGALLALAGENENAGALAQAQRAYAAARELAPHDADVLAAGADHALRGGSLREALPMLDELAASYPEMRARVFPVLTRVLVEGQEREAWSSIAARSPQWMGAFIVSACQQGTDPAALVPLVLGRVARGGAEPSEAGCVIDRLRDADRWQEAYHLWLNTLPRERLADVGNVFNGSFEFAPSGVGFDWRPTRSRERDVGHTVEMPQAVGVDGKRALRVSYSGKRQSGTPIAQYLALPAGRYELSGLGKPQSIAAGRGVQWTMRCVKDGKAQEPLAVSERFVGSSDWRRFAFPVTVAAGCPGQVLQLETVGMGEGPVYLSGVAWFDALVLRRRG